ncbi:MAG: hypothetical protein ACRC2R_06655 [Xenococcaceae cyanobacterium]
MNANLQLNNSSFLEPNIISCSRTSEVRFYSAIASTSTTPQGLSKVVQISAITQPKQELNSFQQHDLKTSTELIKFSNLLYSKIEALFWSAKEEYFEDGMESKFSDKLISTINNYGNHAIEVIICLIVYGKVSPEVAGEALRWLGRIENPETYQYRRWLLERSLSLSSPIVKDGAILGLASMDDKHAISYLKRAIENEKDCLELNSDIEQVLEQLESE